MRISATTTAYATCAPGQHGNAHSAAATMNVQLCNLTCSVFVLGIFKSLIFPLFSLGSWLLIFYITSRSICRLWKSTELSPVWMAHKVADGWQLWGKCCSRLLQLLCGPPSRLRPVRPRRLGLGLGLYILVLILHDCLADRRLIFNSVQILAAI